MESSDFNAKFGREILRLRTTLGISLRELAELAGLTASYINSIEHGKRDPCLSTILALSEALGIQPSELFDSPFGLSPSAMEMARLWLEVPPEIRQAIVDLLVTMGPNPEG